MSVVPFPRAAGDVAFSVCRPSASDLTMVDVSISPYPGGKGSQGTAQRLINLMPPHRVYLEPFLGGGAVMRRKRLAAVNIGVDLDADVIDSWRVNPAVELHQRCGIEYLWEYDFRGDELVYADPPYLFETRAAGRAYYRHEMPRHQHQALLAHLIALPCYVMVSGYDSSLYRRMLRGWHCESYQVTTRGGTTRTEHVWCNFAPPSALHDYRYLGENFRERQRIKRKRERELAKFAAMSPLERQAMLTALNEAWPRNQWHRSGT